MLGLYTAYVGKVIAFVRLQFSSRADVGIVVATCNESSDNREALRLYQERLEISGYSVELVRYCKCGTGSECNVLLENIGREGHTFLWHVSHNYHRLHELTLFVNGGFKSKAYGVSAMENIVSMLSEGRAKQQLRSMYIDQLKHSSGDISKLGEKSHVLHRFNCSSVRSYCSSQENLCTISDLPCKAQQKCACVPQKECRWIGTTSANPRFDEGRLAPATEDFNQTHSFFSWACARFGILPEQIIACGYSWGAIFAVGKSRLQRLSLQKYDQILKEYDLQGVNGGIMGHYMKRLYRSLYLC